MPLCTPVFVQFGYTIPSGPTTSASVKRFVSAGRILYWPSQGGRESGSPAMSVGETAAHQLASKPNNIQDKVRITGNLRPRVYPG